MLALTLLCVGRAKAGPDRDLASRYLERIRAIGRSLGLTFVLHEIAESRAARPSDRKTEEANAIRARIDTKIAEAIVFDETGETIDSESFAGLIRRAAERGDRSLFLVIGGPDGLDPSIRAAADKVIAFGAMTFPHQLVRIMVSEQIYRAATILSGHPYHRG